MTIALQDGENIIAVVMANGDVIHAGEFRYSQDSAGRKFIDAGNCNNRVSDWHTDNDGILCRR